MCQKKIFVEIHQKSKLHQAKSVTISGSQGKKIYIQINQANFKEKAVSSLQAADTPLHQINHPVIKSLFVAMGKPLPSETAARASVARLAPQKRMILENYFGTKKYY